MRRHALAEIAELEEPVADYVWMLPEFDWQAPISANLALAIATFGDEDMRMRLLAHPDCTATAVTEMLRCGSRIVVSAAKAHPLYTRAARRLSATRTPSKHGQRRNSRRHS